MIRVLSVVHGNTFGGPHNRNANLAPLLKARYGIETTVLIPREPGNAADRLRAHGVEVVEVPIMRLRAKKDPRVHWHFIQHFLSSSKAITQIIKERRIDLVQINGISNPHGAVAARGLKVPIVWQMLDTFPPKWFLFAIMPYVRRTAGALMSTGERVARAHPGALKMGERLVYFYPPVNVERFHFDPEQRNAARRELGLADGDEVIGNVSNLNPQKGHRTFIRAAAHLKQKRPNAKFVILGRRYEAHRGYIDALFKEASTLGLNMGRDLVVRDPELRVAELSMAFDVFWMTSEPRSEGIPTAIEEAMALGLPVVATDVGSIGEIVRHQETGYLIEPRDASGASKHTLQLLDDADLRQRFGQAGAAFARKHFTIHTGAQRHVEAYQLALGCKLPILE